MSMIKFSYFYCSYMECGSVYNLIKAGTITEDVGKRIIREVLMGLHFLHRNSVIHR